MLSSISPSILENQSPSNSIHRLISSIVVPPPIDYSNHNQNFPENFSLNKRAFHAVNCEKKHSLLHL